MHQDGRVAAQEFGKSLLAVIPRVYSILPPGYITLLLVVLNVIPSIFSIAGCIILGLATFIVQEPSVPSQLLVVLTYASEGALLHLLFTVALKVPNNAQLLAGTLVTVPALMILGCLGPPLLAVPVAFAISSFITPIPFPLLVWEALKKTRFLPWLLLVWAVLLLSAALVCVLTRAITAAGVRHGFPRFAVYSVRKAFHILSLFAVVPAYLVPAAFPIARSAVTALCIGLCLFEILTLELEGGCAAPWLAPLLCRMRVRGRPLGHDQALELLRRWRTPLPEFIRRVLMTSRDCLKDHESVAACRAPVAASVGLTVGVASAVLGCVHAMPALLSVLLADSVASLAGTLCADRASNGRHQRLFRALGRKWPHLSGKSIIGSVSAAASIFVSIRIHHWWEASLPVQLLLCCGVSACETLMPKHMDDNTTLPWFTVLFAFALTGDALGGLPVL